MRKEHHLAYVLVDLKRRESFALLEVFCLLELDEDELVDLVPLVPTTKVLYKEAIVLSLAVSQMILHDCFLLQLAIRLNLQTT